MFLACQHLSMVYVDEAVFTFSLYIYLMASHQFEGKMPDLMHQWAELAFVHFQVPTWEVSGFEPCIN